MQRLRSIDNDPDTRAGRVFALVIQPLIVAESRFRYIFSFCGLVASALSVAGKEAEKRDPE